MKPTKFLLLLLFTGFLFTACSDDDDDNPDPINEEETITTMTITLTPEGGGDPIIFQTRDIDADGPNPPEVTSENLIGNTTYNGSIVVLNETETPPENVTEEIEREDDEHQFIFEFEGSIDTVTATDTDDNGNPVGLAFRLSTLTAGPTALTVTLRHEPTKPNDGTLAGAGGETDITGTFNFDVVDQ